MTHTEVETKAKEYFKRMGHDVEVTSIEEYSKPELMWNGESYNTEEGVSLPIQPGNVVTYWVSVSNGTRSSAVAFEEFQPA